MSEHDVKNGHSCPHCAATMHPDAKMCWTCGHELGAVNEPSHAEVFDLMRARMSEPTQSVENADPVDQIPLVEWESEHSAEPMPPEPTAAAAPEVLVRDAVPARQPRNWSLALVGGAGVLACAIAMVFMQSPQPAASPQPVATPAPATPVNAAAAPVVESGPIPTWAGSRQATWANDGSKTISFELQSINDVNVWMARVRPHLIVRCLYRTTEVFVATQSSASIEGQSGNHTVRLSIDNDPELVQQWTDSVSGQELFAPNGVALARRLAKAERLRFSFTPYNAKPVTAEFAVAGFDAMAGLVGKTCGWKLDESAQTRTARR